MNRRSILINESQRQRLLEAVQEHRSSWSTYSPRLEAIERGLRQAVVPPSAASVERAVVTLGSRVRVRDLAEPRGRDWLIVYPECADPQMGALSIFSPLGWELLGRRPGEQFGFDDGKELVRYEIEYVLSPVPAGTLVTQEA